MFIVPLALVLTLAGAEPEGRYPVAVSWGFGGTWGPPSAGIHGTGRARFHASRALAVEAVATEGYATAEGRVIGTVGLGVRFQSPPGVYARVGFEHHHETPWAVFRDAPLGALLGSTEGIRHRSGAEVGMGLARRLEVRGLADRLESWVEASISGFSDDSGPRAYADLDAGLTIYLGRPAR